MKTKMEISKLAEVDSTDLFGEFKTGHIYKNNYNNNHNYCYEFSIFSTKYDDDFILHIGEDSKYYEETLERMKVYGCSEDFIEAYKQAKEAGAIRVLFYV